MLDYSLQLWSSNFPNEHANSYAHSPYSSRLCKWSIRDCGFDSADSSRKGPADIHWNRTWVGFIAPCSCIHRPKSHFSWLPASHWRQVQLQSGMLASSCSNKLIVESNERALYTIIQSNPQTYINWRERLLSILTGFNNVCLVRKTMCGQSDLNRHCVWCGTNGAHTHSW